MPAPSLSLKLTTGERVIRFDLGTLIRLEKSLGQSLFAFVTSLGEKGTAAFSIESVAHGTASVLGCTVDVLDGLVPEGQLIPMFMDIVQRASEAMNGLSAPASPQAAASAN